MSEVRFPAWNRDELILALDLYLSSGWLDDSHPKVQELSGVIQNLPLHPGWRGNPSFRSPDAVSMKVANFQALDPAYPGRGLAGVSKGDQEVWDEYHSNPELVAQMAQAIRQGAATPAAETSADGEDSAAEGKILTRVHQARERNQKLVRTLKKRRLDEFGTLMCEACDFDFVTRYGERGHGFIECHHNVPLSQSGETTTRIDDLALLCANCHRMIHVRSPMLTVAELRKVILPPK